MINKGDKNFFTWDTFSFFWLFIDCLFTEDTKYGTVTKCLYL